MYHDPEHSQTVTMLQGSGDAAVITLVVHQVELGLFAAVASVPRLQLHPHSETLLHRTPTTLKDFL
ncbi:hypothetical protein E2C01_081607 [Portunus trituberculatus]|uniref:Uncharacterized protein n=1 Tax=Portunus trituberculatus TaxID=210409 RepID=A0A5B7IMP6_PORTR|nr:hypothetical protein [Portunus trituberculatus]